MSKTGIGSVLVTPDPGEEPLAALDRIARRYGRNIEVIAKVVDFNESRVKITTLVLPTPTEEMRGTLIITKGTGGSGEDEMFLCRMGIAAALEWHQVV